MCLEGDAVTPSEEFDILSEICKTLGWAEASRQTGIKKATLKYRMKKVYPDFKVDPVIGKQKWYRCDVQKMLKAKAQGQKLTDYAKSIGITKSTINNIMHNVRKRGIESYPVKG